METHMLNLALVFNVLRAPTVLDLDTRSVGRARTAEQARVHAPTVPRASSADTPRVLAPTVPRASTNRIGARVLVLTPV